MLIVQTLDTENLTDAFTMSLYFSDIEVLVQNFKMTDITQINVFITIAFTFTFTFLANRM